MAWSRRFDEPIQPPKGKKLVTLKDAAAYILALETAKPRMAGGWWARPFRFIPFPGHHQDTRAGVNV